MCDIYKDSRGTFFRTALQDQVCQENKTGKTIFPPQEHYFFHRTPVLIPKGTPGQTQGEPFLRYMVGPLQYPAKPRGNWRSSPNFLKNTPRCVTLFCPQGGGRAAEAQALVQ